MKSNITNPIYSEIHHRLLSHLDFIRIQPLTILYLSWHDIFSKENLQRRYPLATITQRDDFLSLNQFTKDGFDLIIADFPLHLFNPHVVLQTFYQLLRPDSLLLFTALGPDTFYELRHSFLSVDKHSHTHDFVDMHHIGDWMQQLGFEDPIVDREEMILAYESLNLFFKDLKNLKIAHPYKDQRRGLMTKNQWKMMIAAYEELKTEGYFPVTLEMIYGHAWKGKKEETEVREVLISVETLKKSFSSTSK